MIKTWATRIQAEIKTTLIETCPMMTIIPKEPLRQRINLRDEKTISHVKMAAMGSETDLHNRLSTQ